MPLTNPPLLSNKELVDSLINESNRYIEGINNKIEYNQLNEIHQSLKRLYRELERRRNKGEIKDC
jgi:hypothetical protein